MKQHLIEQEEMVTGSLSYHRWLDTVNRMVLVLPIFLLQVHKNVTVV